MSPLLLTRDEAADRLGISRRRLAELVRTRQVQFTAVGRFARFSEADLAAFIDRYRTEPRKRKTA